MSLSEDVELVQYVDFVKKRRTEYETHPHYKEMTFKAVIAIINQEYKELTGQVKSKVDIPDHEMGSFTGCISNQLSSSHEDDPCTKSSSRTSENDVNEIISTSSSSHRESIIDSQPLMNITNTVDPTSTTIITKKSKKSFGPSISSFKARTGISRSSEGRNPLESSQSRTATSKETPVVENDASASAEHSSIVSYKYATSQAAYDAVDSSSKAGKDSSQDIDLDDSHMKDENDLDDQENESIDNILSSSTKKSRRSRKRKNDSIPSGYVTCAKCKELIKKETVTYHNHDYHIKRIKIANPNERKSSLHVTILFA